MFGKPKWKLLLDFMPTNFRAQVDIWHDDVVADLLQDLPGVDLDRALTLTYGQLVWNFDSWARCLTREQSEILDVAVTDAESRLSAKVVGRTWHINKSLWPEALALIAFPQGRSDNIKPTNGSSPELALDFTDALNEIAAAAAACLFWSPHVKLVEARVSERKAGDLLVVKLEDDHPLSDRSAKLFIRVLNPGLASIMLRDYLAFRTAPYDGYVRVR